MWGNLTKVGANDTYYWDSADRLTKYDGSGSANDTAYTYAPGSWERVKRTRAGSTTYSLWDGDNLESEYLTDGTRSQAFLMGGLDGQLSTTTTGGTYYYLHDGLGSVRNLIEPSETVTNTYDTRAYGQDQGTQVSGATNPFRYTGAYDDAWESAQGPVYYLRNRYYMPNVGLFASRDAMWADLAKGWDYVVNLPTEYVDPYGLGVFGNLFFGKNNNRDLDWVQNDRPDAPDISRPISPTAEHWKNTPFNQGVYNDRMDDLQDTARAASNIPVVGAPIAVLNAALRHVRCPNDRKEMLKDLLPAVIPLAAKGLGVAGELAGGALGKEAAAGEGALARALASSEKAAAQNLFTKEMLSKSQVIAKGNRIREVDGLVKEYGGTVSGWVKKKGWDATGREWHWYEHNGIGRVKVK